MQNAGARKTRSPCGRCTNDYLCTPIDYATGDRGRFYCRRGARTGLDIVKYNHFTRGIKYLEKFTIPILESSRRKMENLLALVTDPRRRASVGAEKPR